MKRTEKIREQILSDVRYHPRDIAAHIGQIFSMSRQGVNRHLKKLVDEGWLVAEGSTRARVYRLGPKRKSTYVVDLRQNPDEFKVYQEHFSWVLEGVPESVEDIVCYGFTEMLNNAIDHSEGSFCAVGVWRTEDDIKIVMIDDGEGIFKRVKRLCKLSDERQAILELSKGKLTTDPDNHSGQGIFFTSRVFDQFEIESKGLKYKHDESFVHDFLFEVKEFDKKDTGTVVSMVLSLKTDKDLKKVFDTYSSDEEGDYAFNKTVIPVRLAQFKGENLVSRSQGKKASDSN